MWVSVCESQCLPTCKYIWMVTWTLHNSQGERNDLFILTKDLSCVQIQHQIRYEIRYTTLYVKQLSEIAPCAEAKIGRDRSPASASSFTVISLTNKLTIDLTETANVCNCWREYFQSSYTSHRDTHRSALEEWVKPFPCHNGSVRILLQGPKDHSFTAGRGL